MKKIDIKKLALLGIAGGALIATQAYAGNLTSQSNGHSNRLITEGNSCGGNKSPRDSYKGGGHGCNNMSENKEGKSGCGGKEGKGGCPGGCSGHKNDDQQSSYQNGMMKKRMNVQTNKNPNKKSPSSYPRVNNRLNNM